MSVSDAARERVIVTVIHAVAGGHDGAKKALRALLAGDSLKDAAAKGGISINRLVRMRDLYDGSLENLESRKRT